MQSKLHPCIVGLLLEVKRCVREHVEGIFGKHDLDGQLPEIRIPNQQSTEATKNLPGGPP